MQMHFAIILHRTGIDRVVVISGFELRLGGALRQAFLRPVFMFERIHATGNIIIRQQQPINRLRRKADIGIDPE